MQFIIVSRFKVYIVYKIYKNYKNYKLYIDLVKYNSVIAIKNMKSAFPRG